MKQTVQPAPRAQLLAISAIFPVAFVLAAFLLETPGRLWHELGIIVLSPDTLMTDYMGLAGVGSALLNAGLLTLAAIAVYWRSGAPVNGSTVACLYLVLGFGLFGKNLLNIWSIVLGVWLYARFRRQPFSQHITTAFFGAALAPVFSEILFSSRLSYPVSIPLAVATSVVLGFLLPPVGAHLFDTHQGYSLYNTGFVAGVLGTLVVAVYNSYGFVPEPVFIWSQGNNLLLGTMFGALFLALVALGIGLDRSALSGLRTLMRQSGRAPSDFVGDAGIGPVLVNMGVTGLMGLAYVLVVGSDLNGPTLGAILSIVGFAAYGKHPGNIIWIIAGVALASTLKIWSIDDPSAVLAALFGTTLAPIAGRFGWHWGIVAGFVHSSVVHPVDRLHAGLMLYNNGFAAGLVAAVLVPVILVLQRPREQQAPGAPPP